MEKTAKAREQSIEQQIGANLEPITSPDDLVGQWEMRFGGPAGSEKVQWRYGFNADGSVAVADEQWRWQLNDDGSLTLAETPEAGETDDSEPMFPYKTSDGRVILSNDDNTLIEILTKLPNA